MIDVCMIADSGEVDMLADLFPKLHRSAIERALLLSRNVDEAYARLESECFLLSSSHVCVCFIEPLLCAMLCCAVLVR